MFLILFVGLNFCKWCSCILVKSIRPSWCYLFSTVQSHRETFCMLYLYAFLCEQFLGLCLFLCSKQPPQTSTSMTLGTYSNHQRLLLHAAHPAVGPSDSTARSSETSTSCHKPQHPPACAACWRWWGDSQLMWMLIVLVCVRSHRKLLVGRPWFVTIVPASLDDILYYFKTSRLPGGWCRNRVQNVDGPNQPGSDCWFYQCIDGSRTFILIEERSFELFWNEGRYSCFTNNSISMFSIQSGFLETDLVWAWFVYLQEVVSIPKFTQNSLL